jgi:hydroxymethylpyrimidine pyrophosphatase-like HAD family hydrolase
VAAMLFATDLDGSFLRSDGTVSERTRSAVRRAHAAGHHVIYATGRPINIMDDVVDAAQHAPVSILANGAHIVDLATRTDIRVDLIQPEQLALAVDAVRSVHPDAIFAVRATDWFGHTRDYQSDYPIPPGARVAHIDELIGEPVMKLLFRLPGLTPESLQLLEERAGRHVSVTYGSTPGALSGATLIEAMAYGVTKASALVVVAERFGIDQCDVVTFGDNRNDVEMLAWAGLGVAMANGSAVAKAAADEVTLTNDDDGVAIVIERFL